jgi:hypothetical protein
MQENAKQRQRILEVLYQARAQSPCRVEKDGWLPEAQIINAVGDCAFALSVLAELKQISRTGYLLRITGAGVLACEAGQKMP